MTSLSLVMLPYYLMEKNIHKSTNRSPVFKAMFTYDMKEKFISTVDIPDITLEVLLELFRFVYYGKCNKTEEIVQEFFNAAEKYDVEELSILCEETMFNNLTEHNAIEYLHLAECAEELECN